MRRAPRVWSRCAWRLLRARRGFDLQLEPSRGLLLQLGGALREPVVRASLLLIVRNGAGDFLLNEREADFASGDADEVAAQRRITARAGLGLLGTAFHGPRCALERPGEALSLGEWNDAWRDRAHRAL